MTWKYHVERIYSIASPRLYYLKQLRCCGVALEDQLMFYKSVIVPITEYACPAWHTSLTKHTLWASKKHFCHLERSYLLILYGIAYNVVKWSHCEFKRDHLYFFNICNNNNIVTYKCQS